MNLKQMRAAALKAAQDIIAKARSESRDLTVEEAAEVDAKFAEIDDLDAKIKSAEESQDRFDRIAALTQDGQDPRGGDAPAKSLGEHFVKSVGAEGFARLKLGGKVDAPEFKAATDTNVTGGPDGPYTDWLVDVDKTLVRPFRQRPVVADLLGAGTISGTTIKYFVELPNPTEGAFATVAETAQKPQMHHLAPTPTTDSLTKIAGWWDNSDEMVEDLPFMVTEINNRGLYLLSMTEEQQLLNGTGTGTDLLGLLNRSGVQVQEFADNPQDTLYRGITKVQTATGLTADGVMINPADYQALRLSKDANGQYFGGGFFTGQYGVNGILENPPLWGLRTIVTAAAPAGTAVVGAFKAAATVYRKGGVRVESTNSDQGKFTLNVITTRIEERIALAVRVPSAIVKVDLTA